MIATRIAVLGAVGILFAGGAVAHAQKTSHAPTPQSLAAKIPVNVKQAILASIIAGDSPTADDKQGGFHEEGGMWVTTTDGRVVAETAVPGKYAKPGESAHVRVNDSANSLPAAQIAAVGGLWHVHPCGEIVTRRVLPPKDEDGKKIITTITRTTYFGQAPSDQDIAGAQLPVNIGIGARNKVAYFYNRSGVFGTMPLDEFLAPLRLPASFGCRSTESSPPAHAD
ncbi:MAG TPA: hypothetical protein VFU57_08315 [Candidatus Acidoferrales bacterium]|nr:hypothetical protein [Candidatus Acidoferrales bacterium]